jgi:hypothetical protein
VLRVIFKGVKIQIQALKKSNPLEIAFRVYILFLQRANKTTIVNNFKFNQPVSVWMAYLDLETD